MLPPFACWHCVHAQNGRITTCHAATRQQQAQTVQIHTTMDTVGCPPGVEREDSMQKDAPFSRRGLRRGATSRSGLQYEVAQVLPPWWKLGFLPPWWKYGVLPRGGCSRVHGDGRTQHGNGSTNVHTCNTIHAGKHSRFTHLQQSNPHTNQHCCGKTLQVL